MPRTFQYEDLFLPEAGLAQGLFDYGFEIKKGL